MRKVKYTDFKYPDAKGKVICPQCAFEQDLPANYCGGCGQELPDYMKQGLTH